MLTKFPWKWHHPHKNENIDVISIDASSIKQGNIVLLSWLIMWANLNGICILHLTVLEMTLSNWWPHELIISWRTLKKCLATFIYLFTYVSINHNHLCNNPPISSLIWYILKIVTHTFWLWMGMGAIKIILVQVKMVANTYVEYSTWLLCWLDKSINNDPKQTWENQTNTIHTT